MFGQLSAQQRSLLHNAGTNDPWLAAAAKKQGSIYKQNIHFDPGVNQQQADEFLGAVGTRSPYGAAVRRDIAPGMQFNNGQYIVTGGGRGVAGWQSYSPGDDYTAFGYAGAGGGGQIWRRKDAAPTPAPTPSPAPTPTPTPTPPASRIDATTPSLATALRDQRYQAGERPALQQALDSALRINGSSDAGADQQPAVSEQRRSENADSVDGSRRFAASDRWRQRLEEVSSRFA